jgi:hypothetical protein
MMTEDTPRGTSPLDIDAALANPSAYFRQPEDVLAHSLVSQAFQLKLLKQWEHDALLLSEAEAEGMGGGEESMLGRVRQALRTLEASMDEGETVGMNAARAAARNVASGIEEAANHARHVASQTREGITGFRAFMRAQPITGALLMLACGYMFGRIAGGRRYKTSPGDSDGQK